MASFRNLLVQGAEQMGLGLSEQALGALCEHQRLLVQWSQKINLTAISDDCEMVDRLYLDSAIVAKWLPENASLHDVGSGAGFPGLVLKIIRPDLQVTLTDARRKRVSFLKHVSRVIGCEQGLSISWRRLGWEDNPIQSTWQEVISRATFPPWEWIRQGEHLVAKDGRLWVMAGHAVAGSDREMDWKSVSSAGLSFDQTFQYMLPFCGLERFLVAFRRR